jgi:replication factor A1
MSLVRYNMNVEDFVTEELDDASYISIATDALRALTPGAVRQICDGQCLAYPILQCVHLERLPPLQSDPVHSGGPERWRVGFRDDANYIFGIIATRMFPIRSAGGWGLTVPVEHNYIATDGRLKKGSVCRLTHYQAHFLRTKYILIVSALDVLSEYGEPHPLRPRPVAIESVRPEVQQDPRS